MRIQVKGGGEKRLGAPSMVGSYSSTKVTLDELDGESRFADT